MGSVVYQVGFVEAGQMPKPGPAGFDCGDATESVHSFRENNSARLTKTTIAERKMEFVGKQYANVVL